MSAIGICETCSVVFEAVTGEGQPGEVAVFHRGRIWRGVKEAALSCGDFRVGGARGDARVLAVRLCPRREFDGAVRSLYGVLRCEIIGCEGKSGRIMSGVRKNES